MKETKEKFHVIAPGGERRLVTSERDREERFWIAQQIQEGGEAMNQDDAQLEETINRTNRRTGTQGRRPRRKNRGDLVKMRIDNISPWGETRHCAKVLLRVW